MNHIYRMIWSSSRGAFVAVSEVATSRSKAAGSGLVAGALVLGASAAMAQGLPAGALPSGGQVTAGQASIQAQGNTMDIVQASQRAAINWQSFNIGSAATVNFVQPNAQAITLNRVVGNERAVIDGALNANGQVWILSAKGVLFNRGAQVNTGGLLATTMNISDEDFMAGRSTFQRNGSTGSVINLGTINAAEGGYVALLGQQVVNEGVITARLGTAVMAAGDQVSLNFNGSSLVGVTVERGVLDALVENKHAIVADGGLVVLTAKGLDEVMATVVNNTGEVRAQTIGEKEGRIYLLGTGAQDRVAVAGKLDASAPTRGNGGFVETSAARVSFAPDVQITTRSAQGQHGTWLIDPNDFTIAASGGDITGATLAANLANNNVIIESVNGGTSGNGDIFVNDDVLKTAGGDTTLTLKAERSISIQQNRTISSTSGKLGVYLSADNDGTHTGSITVGQGVNIRTNGGDVIMGGALASGLPSNDHMVNITFSGGASAAAATVVDAGDGDVKLFGKAVSLNAFTQIKGRNILADVASMSFNAKAGIQFTAQEDLTFRSVGALTLTGRWQAPNGYTDVSPETQTFVSAGDTMRLEAGQSITTDGMAIRLNSAGVDNDLTIKAGENASFTNTSVSFAGTPLLTLLLKQNHQQSEVISTYASLADYLAGTGNTLFKMAVGANGGLTLSGAHFGIMGGSYRLGLYSDATVQTVAPKSIDNGLLAMGTGLDDSVSAQGNLQQPFYYDSLLRQWSKLTFNNYSLTSAVGVGGTETAGWNGSGTILADGTFTSAMSGLSIDYSGLTNGVGVVNVSYNLLVPNNGGVIRMTQAYSLGAGESFIKNVTTTTNVGSGALSNVRLWVGTQDDYIANTDTNYKTKGNLSATGFDAITSQNEQARSIVISQYDPLTSNGGSAVLFHSTNVDADTVTDAYGSFSSRITNKDPRQSSIQAYNDGSYGIFMNYGGMDASESRTVTWYYGATRLSEINTLINQVNNAGGLEIVTALPTNRPSTVTPPTTKVPESVVANAINPTVTPPVLPTSGERLMGPSTERVGNVVNMPSGVDIRLGRSEQLLLTASLDGDVPNQPVTLSQAREMLGGSTQGGGQQGGGSPAGASGGSEGSASVSVAAAGGETGASGSSGGNDPSTKGDGTGEDAVRIPAGRNSRVLIVNGGVRLPSGVDQQLFVVRK